VLPWKSNKYYAFWVCVCSLSYPASTAHAPYYTLICGLSGSTIFFRIISQTERCRENVMEHKMCVLIFSTTFVSKFLILKRIQRFIIINLHKSLRKVTVILVGFQWKFNFLDIISKNHQISNFMKICPLGAQLFHANRHDKTVIFHNLRTCLKIQYWHGIWNYDLISDSANYSSFTNNYVPPSHIKDSCSCNTEKEWPSDFG
jgi:hypothetical protein